MDQDSRGVGDHRGLLHLLCLLGLSEHQPWCMGKTQPPPSRGCGLMGEQTINGWQNPSEQHKQGGGRGGRTRQLRPGKALVLGLQEAGGIHRRWVGPRMVVGGKQ